MRVGLIVHHPTTGHKFQLLSFHKGLHLLLGLLPQLLVPPGKVRDLCPDEPHVHVLVQVTQHVGQDEPGLCLVVLVEGLEPAWVVVRVRHNEYLQWMGSGFLLWVGCE